MFRFRASHLFLFLLLPAYSFAAEAHYCIAVDGGFGHGGTTFIGTGFTLPSEGNCNPWVGFTKAENTVILNTIGTGCLSSDGKVIYFSMHSTDPSFSNQSILDYIKMSRGTTSEPFSGSDNGSYFGGTAKPESCTSTLLHLPDSHD